jgi:hypothetical protein
MVAQVSQDELAKRLNVERPKNATPSLMPMRTVRFDQPRELNA